MKNLFLTFKLKYLIMALFVFTVFIIGVFYNQASYSSIPKAEFCVVIDAGHGGRDGGTVGKETGITESQLNLDYALTLADFCKQFGFDVVLTRSTMDGLYDENATNKKKSEMEKRKNIINNSNGDIMISLHMNSYPLSSLSGAYVFYANGSGVGLELAKNVQTSLCKSFSNARDFVSVGDYFVLNYSNIPAVLVECGFLSNPTEERLLQQKEYRESFCYSVLAGIIDFFKM